jgi:thioredoxin-like negative regulator of GroEL
MHFNVSGIPTMILFRDGEVLERIVGFMPKPQLMKRLEPHLETASTPTAEGASTPTA